MLMRARTLWAHARVCLQTHFALFAVWAKDAQARPGYSSGEGLQTDSSKLGNRSWIQRSVAGLIVGLSAAILAAMLWSNWPTLLAYRAQIQLWPFLFAPIPFTLATLLAVVGWGRIMRSLTRTISFRDHCRIYYLTLAAGLLPGIPWHIAGRAVLYKQLGIPRRITGLAAAVEMILIIVSGLWLGLLILPFLPSGTRIQLVWLLLGSIPVLGLIHPGTMRRILKRLGQGEATPPLRYRDTLALVALYFGIWSVGGCILYSVTLAFYPLPITELPAIIGVWALAGAMSTLASLSPTSLGIKEVALTLLLAIWVPPGLAVLIAIAARLFQTAAVFIGALFASRL